MWKGKPAGLLSVSIGAPGEGVFEASGQLRASTAKLMQTWMAAYLAFVKHHAA